MNNNNKPVNETAPVKKTAKTAKIFVEGKIKTYTTTQERQAEAKARMRMRRKRKLLKLGLTEEQIKKLEANEKVRTIICMVYQHKMKEVLKAAEESKIDILTHDSTTIWVNTTVDKAEETANIFAQFGRVYIQKWHPKEESVKKEKKPTNNTAEKKTAAKKVRKNNKVDAAKMRPYYAALRKGGVSERIKKHNPTLADKIENWLKERAKIEAEKAERNKEHRAKHNQLTTLERKANKYARKEAKRKAAQERRKAQELKRMEHNAKIREKRAQKAQKPVQTELKMAA